MAIGSICRPSWRSAKLRGAALCFAALVSLWCEAAAAQSFTLTLQPNTIPAATQNTAYNQLITAVGGNAPYTFDTSDPLPPGMTLASDGTLSGTPTTPNSYTFTINATDSTGNTGYRPYTFSVGTSGLLSLAPASLPDGSQGVAYSQTVTASGGSGGYVYSISAGSLPTGLSLNSGNGAITGTPTTGGPFNFTVFARDSNGNTGTRAYTVNIGTNSLTVNPSSLPNGTQGTPYSQTVTASGGTGPYTFALTSGSLPAGLSLSSGGAITGTPTGSGASNFTIRATDSVNNVGSRAYTVNIGTNSLTVNPASLPNGSQGTAYSQTVTASGGTAPYSFAVTAGALPTGLSLSSGGAITGTPSASGTFNFTIQATDPNFNTGSRAYAVTISLAALTISPPTLPAGTQGVAYSQSVTASGGTAPYDYIVLSGALPPGLSLNSGNGLISGTPTAGGAYSFTIQATDATPNTGTRAYTLNIGTNSLTVNPASLPNGTQGAAYSQTVSASGGSGPYAFALTAGSLPAGLSLSSGGAITGTPSGSGPSSFTVHATDSIGNTGSRAYAVNIGTNSLTVNPSSLPPGTQGTAYSQTVSASGGTGPYTFALTSGALPAGLSLNAGSGAITGTPTGSGPSSFTVQATDTLGNVGSRAFTVNIGTVSLTVNPASLPAAVMGKPYSQTVSATGGTAPYTFSVSSGALPPGLTLNATSGVISGTPTTLGASSFTIQALDVNGNSGSRAYALVNRPDPAADPEVQGLVAAQAATARRFATAQLDNVMRHMERLHGRFDPCSLDFGVTLPQDPQAQPYQRSPFYGPPAGAYGSPPNSPAGEIARRTPGAAQCADEAFALWVSGAVQFGSETPGGLASSNRFTTAGLTAGVDWRAADSLIVGFAVGYGSDRSDVGFNGTRSDATSVSGTLYATFKPFDPWFIDAAIGYGTLGYDNRRWVSNDGALVAGNRKGSYWFGTVSTSVELKYDALRLMPYLRADFMTARLDGYSEQGTSAELLTYESVSFNSVSGAVGMRGSYDIPTGWGVLTPLARVEYRQALDGAFDQSMYYSDLGPGVTSVLNQASATRSMLNASLGLRARGVGGFSAELEYGTSSWSGALLSQSLRGSVRMPF